MVVTIGIYALAALFNLRIPDTGARYPGHTSNPFTVGSNTSLFFI